jgi:molecular chaperone DnaJ
MSRDDLYIILEIGRTASVNDIKKAFRKLARRYHPDINPGDHTAEERFKRISEAYEILSDPSKRQFYDENGFYTEGVLNTRTTSEWGFSFEGFDFSRMGSSGFADTFGQVFARAAVRRESERGTDLEYQISLGFDESIKGTRTKISLLRKSPCGSCKGNGRMVGSRDIACPRCSGMGKTSVAKGLLQFTVNCSDCGGAGKQVTVCQDCAGEGRIPRHDLIEIEIPAGVSTGSRIRFPGQGDAGRLNGPPGDLYVLTNVAAHPFFSRAGDNIHCILPITITEAVLGAKIEVPTIDGRAMVRIPPGTQNGQTFRLRTKGAPSLIDPGARGDQYVEVRVIVPRVGDERSKDILRELAKLNPQDPRKEIWK